MKVAYCMSTFIQKILKPLLELQISKIAYRDLYNNLLYDITSLILLDQIIIHLIWLEYFLINHLRKWLSMMNKFSKSFLRHNYLRHKNYRFLNLFICKNYRRIWTRSINCNWCFVLSWLRRKLYLNISYWYWSSTRLTSFKFAHQI